MENCIFCKIASGEIPSKKVYEDDKAIAFYDLEPQAPVHVLIVPKKHMITLPWLTTARSWAILCRLHPLLPNSLA